MSGYAANRKAPSRPRRNNSIGDFDGEPESTTQAPITGGVFKSAAFEVLNQEQRLMTSGEITKLAMERNLLKCSGKTPEATMASALYTEVRKKALTTVFIKPKEGLFGLKAWLQEPWLLNWLAQEGIDPADLLDPGGGLVEPHPKKVRTSYNGAAARAASGMGYPAAFAGSGQRVPVAPRPSLSGLGPGVAPPLGGGAVGQRASLNGMATAAAGVSCGAGGGPAVGGLRSSSTGFAAAPGCGAAPRPPIARSTVSGAVPAVGGATDSVSNLQLLLDAADEIEGSVPEDKLLAVEQPVRRRSDGAARQSTAQRPRQAPSRELSQPSIIGRARARAEGDYGEHEEAEGASLEEDSHEAQLLRIQQAALHYRQQRLKQQQQEQQQQQQRRRRKAQRPQGRGPARGEWEGESDDAEQPDDDDGLPQAKARGGARWPAGGSGLGPELELGPPLPGSFRRPHLGRGGGVAGPGAPGMLHGSAAMGLPDGPRRHQAQRTRDADMADMRAGREDSGEDEAAAALQHRSARSLPAERRGSPGGLQPAPTPAHRIFMEHKQRGVLPPARRSPLPKAVQTLQADHAPPRGSGLGDRPRGGSAGSSAGCAGGSPTPDGVCEQVPSTEQVVEHLRAVLASNGALSGGLGFGAGAAAGAAAALDQPATRGLAGAHGSEGLDDCGAHAREQMAAALGVSVDALTQWASGPDQAGSSGGGAGAWEGKPVKAEAGSRRAGPSDDDGAADWGSGRPGAVGASLRAESGAHRHDVGSRMAAGIGDEETKLSASALEPGMGDAAVRSELSPAPAVARDRAEGEARPREAGGLGSAEAAASAGVALGSIAVHDAMNSPDSQAAGPSERPSPDADADGQHCNPGRAAVGGRPVFSTAGALEAVRPNSAGVPHPIAASALPSQGQQETRWQQPAVCGASRAPSDDAGVRTHMQSQLRQQQQQSQAQLPVTQVALIQKQYLKLLPAVDAARPGDVPDPDAINRIRQQVLDMESRMGAVHPETGRAYVLLARVLEHKSTLWSLTMAERALLRAWTIVGMGAAGSPGGLARRSSESGAAAVAGVAAAAVVESGAAGVKELLGQLPDSFSTFQYVLEQIRLKQGVLQQQQQQQLAAVLRAAFAASAGAAAGAAGEAAMPTAAGGEAPPQAMTTEAAPLVGAGLDAGVAAAEETTCSTMPPQHAAANLQLLQQLPQSTSVEEEEHLASTQQQQRQQHGMPVLVAGLPASKTFGGFPCGAVGAADVSMVFFPEVEQQR